MPHLDSLAVTEAEIEEAEQLVSQELKDALHLAHHNIAAFHQSQKFEGTENSLKSLLGIPISTISFSICANDVEALPEPILLISRNTFNFSCSKFMGMFLPSLSFIKFISF